MKRTYQMFAGLLVLLTLSACSPTLTSFTQRMYDEYDWTESELKRIQFYVSDDIVLRRQLTGGKSEIISGEIKVIDGREVEEVVIRRKTPGVLLFLPKENRFAVSFEADGDDRYLVFGPNPKAGSRYALLASEWRRRSGTVTYEGRKFQVDASSAFASLMVDLKKIRKISVSSRTARGRKVND
ncbi:hypothetical protein [Flavilitoribacter nigricans]|nr:hypothetical protein [Flavilitoribacter nigricans]